MHDRLGEASNQRQRSRAARRPGHCVCASRLSQLGERAPARRHPIDPIRNNTMTAQPTSPAADTRKTAAIGDGELAARIARHDQAAFEAMMRQHNGKLFRVARAILKDDAEAEDALQDSYLEAYRHIGEFRGGARLSTWLTRIVINQSLMRLPKHKRGRVVVPFVDAPAQQDEKDADMADERTE